MNNPADIFDYTYEPIMVRADGVPIGTIPDTPGKAALLNQVAQLQGERTAILTALESAGYTEGDLMNRLGAALWDLHKAQTLGGMIDRLKQMNIGGNEK